MEFLYSFLLFGRKVEENRVKREIITPSLPFFTDQVGDGKGKFLNLHFFYPLLGFTF